MENAKKIHKEKKIFVFPHPKQKEMTKFGVKSLLLTNKTNHTHTHTQQQQKVWGICFAFAVNIWLDEINKLNTQKQIREMDT